MAEPIKAQNYISEVLVGQTAAQWEASGGNVYLQAFEIAVEADTKRTKSGPGLFSELPYDNPQGQTWQNTSGTPTSTDLIGYTAVTAAVTATAEWTCDDVGTAAATVIVGNKLYTVVASGATGDEIDAGASATEYADNIATKVTTDTADTLCTATNDGAVITFTANTTGAAGNDIPLSTTDENITSGVFADGADAVYTPKTTTVDALGSNVITGTIDCSTNPNYPAATKGDIYVVSVAGKIGGASGITVEVGDWAVAIATNAGGSQASVGASWDIIQTNITRPTSGYTTTATAAGTTTLTEPSTYQQFFTGATTQTVVLPVVTTLQLGWSVYVANDSSGVVTVNSSGANAVQVMAAGSRAIITCILLTGTSAASWSVTYLPAVSTVIADGDGNPITSNAVFDALALKVGGNATDNIGYLNIPQNSQSDNYVCVLTDAGKHILQTGATKTVTIPANGSVAYPIGTTLTVIPTNATGCTVPITTDTLIWADGGGTGTRTLAQYAMFTAVKTDTTTWICSGVGVS